MSVEVANRRIGYFFVDCGIGDTSRVATSSFVGTQPAHSFAGLETATRFALGHCRLIEMLPRLAAIAEFDGPMSAMGH
jgi:hypothetical protein